VLNAAARQIYGVNRVGFISDIMRDNFIGCELVSVSTLNCAFSSTKLFMVSMHQITLPKCLPVGSVEARRRLRLSTAGNFVVPATITQFG